MRGAAIALGGGSVAWTAAPVVHTGYADFALVAAICCASAAALRLLTTSVPVPEDGYLMPAPLRVLMWFLEALRNPPWEEGTLVFTLWLEAIHPARPWHTAVLGAALAGYLLAVHLAESGASPRVLGVQAPVLAAAVALIALGPARRCCRAAGTGAGSALLRVIAAVALLAAGGLVLPALFPRKS